MGSTSRRDFLKVIHQALLWISAGLGLGGVIRFLDYAPYPAPQTEFNLGPVQQYPPGSRTLLSQVPALLVHEEAGFKALSLVCTHLGCTLEQDGQNFRCPCHGSLFDTTGKVTRGPAVNPLPFMRLETRDDDQIMLYTE